MSAFKVLREAVVAATKIVNESDDEPEILQRLGPVLSEVTADDSWWPDAYRFPHPDHYQAFLLHGDPLGRLSIIAYAWGPGQKTPLHDHRMWGMIGVARGALLNTPYQRAADGTVTAGAPQRLCPGDAAARVSPRLGDLHILANAEPNDVSLSIHMYGGDVSGTVRGIYDPVTGVERPFVSGYANVTLPNLWDRLAEMRARAA